MWKITITEKLRRTVKQLVDSVERGEPPDIHVFNIFKRELALEVAKLIVEVLGVKNVKAIYYADLVGGAQSTLGVGRDVDLIVWVERGLTVDASIFEHEVNNAVVRSFLEDLSVDLRDIVGPNVVEIHFVRDLQREPLGRFIMSSMSPVIQIWGREKASV